jgi:hypothetical protein
MEPERVKLKNLHVRSRCQGMASEDIAGWRKLSGCCELWRLAVAPQLLVVSGAVYKWSTNSFTNQNPVNIKLLKGTRIFKSVDRKCSYWFRH